MEHCQMHAAHEARMDGFDETVKDVHQNLREIVKGQAEIRERLVRAENNLESVGGRISQQEEYTKAVTRMSISIEHMAEQVKEAICLLKDHDGRIADLERVPNEEIKTLLETTAQRVEKLERAPGELLLSWGKLAIGTLITGGAGILVGTLIQ